jgi:hypothetical protein
MHVVQRIPYACHAAQNVSISEVTPKSAQKQMCITHEPRVKLHNTTMQACGQGPYEEVCMLGWSVWLVLSLAVG